MSTQPKSQIGIAMKAYDENLPWEAQYQGGEWKDMTYAGCPVFFIRHNPGVLIRIKPENKKTK